MSNLRKAAPNGIGSRYKLPNGRQIPVTWFFDEEAKEKIEVAYPWSHFIHLLREPPTSDVKQKLPWIKLARFGNVRTDSECLRHNANVISVSGIEGDYDDEVVTPEEARRRLDQAGIKAVVVTTPSHRPDRPRWRVYAPLSANVAPEERKRLCARLNGALGGILKTESFTLSQGFFLGHLDGDRNYIVLRSRGDYLDDVEHVREIDRADTEFLANAWSASPNLRAIFDNRPDSLIDGEGNLKYRDAGGRLDRSRVDEATCAMLSQRGCGNDAARIEHLFRASEWYRAGLLDPDLERRKTLMSPSYLTRTIRKAIAWAQKNPLSVKMGDDSRDAAERFVPPDHWQDLDVARVENWDCERPPELVENLICVGTFVSLVADSQTGKTLLALNVSKSLATGLPLFGRYGVAVPRKIIYLALEDPPWRFKDRLLDMANDFAVPHEAEFIVKIMPGFALTDDAQFTWLESYLRDQGDDIVVWLDTYQRATPGILSYDDKDQSKIIQRLASFVRERRTLTFIILDHLRLNRDGRAPTLADVKGTGLKVQNLDNAILLTRSKGGAQMTLHRQAKDFDDDANVVLKVSPRGSGIPKFAYQGDVKELAEASKEKGEASRQAILDVFEDGEEYVPAELEEFIKLTRKSIAKHCKALAEEGKLASNGKSGRALRYRSVG